MISKLRKRFTLWYVKRGYTFGYKPVPMFTDADHIFATPAELPDTYFICPFWVKPFLVLFSPSIYFMETMGKLLAEAFRQGVEQGSRR